MTSHKDPNPWNLSLMKAEVGRNHQRRYPNSHSGGFIVMQYLWFHHSLPVGDFEEVPSLMLHHGHSGHPVQFCSSKATIRATVWWSWMVTVCTISLSGQRLLKEVPPTIHVCQRLWFTPKWLNGARVLISHAPLTRDSGTNSSKKRVVQKIPNGSF